MAGQNLVFYGTTGPSGTATGDSQPDRSQWLGRFRASQTVRALASTLTASQTLASRHFIVDSARIGDGVNAHALKWILIHTGPAAMSPARVESFDNATGTFKLDRPTTGTAVAGNAYSLYAKNNVWPDVTAAQAAAGETRYRCVVMRNEQGAALTLVRYHLVPLMVGGGDFARVNQVNETAPFLQRASDQTDIFSEHRQTDTLGVGSNNFLDTGYWLSPQDRAAAGGEEDASLSNTNGNAVWLRRVVPPGLRFRRSVAVMLVVSTSVTTSDPNPLVSGCIMPYDILGDATAILEPDRFPHVGGGVRYRGTVLASGIPVADRPVQFRVKAGDVGSIVIDGDPVAGYDVTDARGRAGATYMIPTSGTPGDPNSVEFVVGAGDEVGDPPP